MQRQIIGILIRGVILAELLLKGIADVFGIAVEQVCFLMEEKKSFCVIFVEYYYCEKGFQTDLTLYIDQDRLPFEIDRFELIRNFARYFNQDILTSPPDSWREMVKYPYLWVLVHPSGEMFRVQELSSDHWIVIDENPSHMDGLDRDGNLIPLQN